eukprot:NODE_602_length_1929_cov_4.713298_g481_i0.p1 GENE.NODE_602_length_1929_cov_4.713298_g481_i0~~NODE_602_length_1929_cov_4.713298_g481_i0.p1  ORF type:complete len:396 (+),score=116.72 NODE_602_length_1929_cov_4.713298_g481_i0:560-1747(+)
MYEKSHSDGRTREPSYMDILRPSNRKKEKVKFRPTIQIHGSLNHPDSVVLTREGYRRLLHERKMYHDFLKSVMSSRTILYIGFSFTDDYLNEVRSDIMMMKKSSGMEEPLAYAIIPDKKQVHKEYYATHEGVQFFSWDSSRYGFGMMDRFLDCILRMSDPGAALAFSKVVIFVPDDSGAEDPEAATKSDAAAESAVAGQTELTSLELQLKNAERSKVFTLLKDTYSPFGMRKVSTLHEVEDALKAEDFIRSYVVIYTDVTLCSVTNNEELRLPALHRELLGMLWHPFSYLNTSMHPTTVIVLTASPTEMAATSEKTEEVCQEQFDKLKTLYEAFLNVRVCTTASDVLWQVSMTSTSLQREAEPAGPATDVASSVGDAAEELDDFDLDELVDRDFD